MRLDKAVRDAAALVDARGSVDDSQIPSLVSCTFGAGKGRAKCNVLEEASGYPETLVVLRGSSSRSASNRSHVPGKMRG